MGKGVAQRAEGRARRLKEGVAGFLALLTLFTAGLALRPSSSEGIIARWYKQERAVFKGAGCGSLDSASIAIQRRARHAHARRPQVGDVFRDRRTAQRVAKVIDTHEGKLDNGQHGFIWRMKGIGDVCTNPGRYPSGWATRRLPLRVDYSTREMVYFYDTRDQKVRTPDFISIGASQTIHSINWKSWDGWRAHGAGTFPFNDCRPYCAAGTITPYPVKVVLSRPKWCGGPFRYVKLTWTFKGKPPPQVGERGSTNFNWLC